MHLNTTQFKSLLCSDLNYITYPKEYAPESYPGTLSISKFEFFDFDCCKLFKNSYIFNERSGLFVI